MDIGSITSQSLSSVQTALAVAAPQVPAPAAATASGAPSNAIGSLDATPSTALLASLGGADTASTDAANLAIAGYQAQQAYPASTPAAQGSPSSTPTTTVADTSTQAQAPAAVAPAESTSPDPALNPAVQQALVASISPGNVSLLA